MGKPPFCCLSFQQLLVNRKRKRPFETDPIRSIFVLSQKYMSIHKIIILVIALVIIPNIIANSPLLPERMNASSNHYYSIYIMDNGKTDAEDLAAMLLFYNPNVSPSLAQEIANIYFEECIDEGVNHDIAFCQMTLETGFLKFGGSVLRSQNNFCGLGATGGSVRGEYFPDMRTGVRAHIQHLKAYASKEDINKPCVDRRYKYVKRGSATTIYALQGKWAADPLYDQKLENLLDRLFLLRRLMASQQNTFEHSF